MFLHKNQFLFSSAVVTQLTNVTDGQNYDIQHLYKTNGSAARPVLVSRASHSVLASYRKVTTCRCLCCACWGCAISADNLCLPLQDDPASWPQGRRQTAGCLDSYLIPQITAARPEAGNARRSVAVVHKPRPTVNICSPDTTVAYVCASAGWLRGHVSGKGANVEYQLR